MSNFVVVKSVKNTIKIFARIVGDHIRDIQMAGLYLVIV